MDDGDWLLQKNGDNWGTLDSEQLWTFNCFGIPPNVYHIVIATTGKVYFSKLYIKSLRNSPIHRGAAMGMGMGSFKSYVRFVRWVPEASILPELDNLLHGFLQMY